VYVSVPSTKSDSSYPAAVKVGPKHHPIRSGREERTWSSAYVKLESQGIKTRIIRYAVVIYNTGIDRHRDGMSIANSNLTQPSIGVVIVNWNGWQNTLLAYESLVAAAYSNWTLVIVDNASTDDSVKKLSDLKNTTLVPSPLNRGFSGGCNLGIAKVCELGLDYVFLLNSDATVSKSALDNLVSASIDLGDRAALGSIVRYWPSGQIQFFGSRRSAVNGRPHWYKVPEDATMLESKLIRTDFILGAALFASVQLFQKIGLFDERFFLNFEETDWCYRATALNIPLYVLGSSVVHHQGGASLGDVDAPLQTYFLYRNRLLFCDKHASIRHRIRGYVWVAGYLASKLGRDFKLFLRCGASIDPSTRALTLALRDYALRRFGDCPMAVRELAKLHRNGARAR
jgi:GT2 family glycosyltransferase